MKRLIVWCGVLIGPLFSGCSAWTAVRPPSFSLSATEIPVEHPLSGIDGTRIGELELTSDSGPAYRRSQVLRSATVEGTAAARLKSGASTQWGVRCEAMLDTAVLPPVRVVCLLAPDVGHLEPLSLVLTSTLGGALRGIFFSMDGPYVLDGTRELELGIVRDDTVGFAVRREGERQIRVFVDVATPQLRAYAEPALTPDELKNLAPLLLVLEIIRDPRAALRGSRQIGFGVGASGAGATMFVPFDPALDDDAKRLPLPPPATPTSTAHEEQAARLAEAGQADLARALWATITSPPW